MFKFSFHFMPIDGFARSSLGLEHHLTTVVGVLAGKGCYPVGLAEFCVAELLLHQFNHV